MRPPYSPWTPENIGWSTTSFGIPALPRAAQDWGGYFLLKEKRCLKFWLLIHKNKSSTLLDARAVPGEGSETRGSLVEHGSWLCQKSDRQNPQSCQEEPRGSSCELRGGAGGQAGCTKALEFSWPSASILSPWNVTPAPKGAALKTKQTNQRKPSKEGAAAGVVTNPFPLS